MIEKHLLNDPTDPFSKQKLSLEMVKPGEDLKLKIEEYKKKKHMEKIAKKQ